MPIFGPTSNPNVIAPRATTVPSLDTPEAQALIMQMLMSQRRGGYLPPPAGGLLDRLPDYVLPGQGLQRGLLAPAMGDVVWGKKFGGSRNAPVEGGGGVVLKMPQPTEIRTEMADKAARRSGPRTGPTPRELHEKFNPSGVPTPQSPSAKDTAQTSFGGAEMWGPKTPGWELMSPGMRTFLKGKPVNTPVSSNQMKTKYDQELMLPPGMRRSREQIDRDALSAKQADQAFRNEWSAWGKKAGIDPAKAAKAAQEIREAGNSQGMSLTPDRIRYLIMLAKQQGKL